MLVLTRKLKQSVAVGIENGIDSPVKVTVLGISGGSVRLGFEVDATIPIHRWEVWERIRDAKLPATPGGAPASVDRS
jgi:carbon storage regulator